MLGAGPSAAGAGASAAGAGASAAGAGASAGADATGADSTGADAAGAAEAAGVCSLAGGLSGSTLCTQSSFVSTAGLSLLTGASRFGGVTKLADSTNGVAGDADGTM